MSATITYLGGEDTGNLGTCGLGPYLFELNKPIVVDDPHVIFKARNNRFFQVDGADKGKASIDKEAKVTPRPSKKAKDE